MDHRLTVFGTAILTGTASLAGAPLASAQAVSEAGKDDQALSSFDMYRLSDYGYCDAKKIAKVWGQSILEGKLTLGEKVRAGLEGLADADIASTENSVSCDWSETELTYDDAEVLAEFWGMMVDEAKAKAAIEVSLSGYKQFTHSMKDVLVSVGDYEEDHPEQSVDARYDIYANSAYGYCDAKKIADVWGTDIWEGKLILADKVSAGLEHLADADIASTIGQVRCAWDETDLIYSDRKKLAAFWGVNTDEAKFKAAERISEMGYKKFRALFSPVLDA